MRRVGVAARSSAKGQLAAPLLLTEELGVEVRAQHGSEPSLPRLLQHTQGPHHVHLQAGVQASQLGPQPLVYLDKNRVGYRRGLCSHTDTLKPSGQAEPPRRYQKASSSPRTNLDRGTSSQTVPTPPTGRGLRHRSHLQ